MFWSEGDGQKRDIANESGAIMPPKGKVNRSTKIRKIIKILKFLLTVDDIELIKAIIESAIDALEEEIN